MQMPVHSSRFEHETINPHHTAEQFKISNAWALLVGSLVLGTGGIFWLVVDLHIFLGAMPEVWLGDHTQSEKYVEALIFAVFMAMHSTGGIIWLLCANLFWTNPHRLILDGNGQLIVLRLMGRKRIAVENIQTVETEPDQSLEGSGSPGIRIQHSDGKVILPLFKQHEKFVIKLKTVCPAIEIINWNSSVLPNGLPS